ncbi:MULTISPECIES: alpha-ketoglutarate-dependent dioxygenase AlkB family protein [unclassified Streptomyces]|uniref:alpha-ketoglutarate-dependent dioxygenase AlkB family protein n=1 Tax=unclassified Streptomyces TaxID=2593676 RepID=UPI0022B628D1|nr:MULTISPECIES: alpha-ketoglutarate-dependent dioxygenase AlkB [unclassified Streptomyces]MCZ7415766.1 alpha-ketoglutarate-dependent dioxygenase AlkB [Streptomyces sp. WMMC897]MCZ7434423.1 alpha-ketoglutarate-dependent dioxygenase AlkB [Streptomyces sp. WMMC1477]
MSGGGLFPRPASEVAPGAVHLPGWLDEDAQTELLAACRAWARPPAGLRTVRMPRGGRMSVRQLSLGWHWYPYGYARTVVDGDGAPVKPFPPWLGEWARAAAARAYGRKADTAYDVALVNFYDAAARMGLHRDTDERSDAPVVSFSLGDTCVFRFGLPRSEGPDGTAPSGRGGPWTDVELASGDAFVFGGPSRHAYHGVPRTRPGTAPAALGLRGRLNVTVRRR